MRPILVVTLVAAALAAGFLATPALARDDDPGELKLLLGFMGSDPNLVNHGREQNWSPAIGLRIGANMDRPWSQFIDGVYSRIDSEPGDHSTVLEARAGMERNFDLSGGGTWYLAGALGWADANLPIPREDFGRPLASLGIGIRPTSGPGTRWHVELREEWWMGDEGLNGANVANTQILVGLGFGLRDTREPMFQRGSRTLVLEGVNFITDSAELTADSKETLDRTVESLRRWPEVRVEVGGHTDSVADDAYNLELSQRRAESVRAYLIHAGIASDRLEAKGYGETRPIAPNDTDAGRAKNRRVELKRID